MKIEVLLTAEVFRRFTLFDMLKRRKIWKRPAIWAAILCTSALVCFLMHHVKGAVLLGGVLMMVGLGMPLSYFASFGASLKQQIVKLGLTRPILAYTLVLTDKNKGIRVSNETEQAEYEWNKVHHAYKDQLATYLFITAERAFILPHVCIEEGEEALWALVEKKLPADRRTVLK